jgi:hypothetical protein
VVERQDVDARSHPQVLRALRCCRQEDVLRWRHGVDGRRVVLGDKEAVEASLIQRLQLLQALLVELIQRHARQVLDMVEDTELQTRRRVSGHCLS